MKSQGILLSLIVISGISSAQNVVNRNDTIKVFHDTIQLQMPWASGLNAGNFGKIDMNLDGIMDLFIMEPNNEANYDTGDKIYPFINQGAPGKADYKLDISYRGKFPILEDYAILKDWNCDGKTDIFTWDVRGRITAYRNVSDTELKFVLEKQILKTDTTGLPYHPSYYHSGEIVWSYFDMPTFVDVDGDGDVDILTTASNGHFIEYNKNMSMEYYGHCDSLTFKLKNTCWGRFFEDTGTVILNTCDIINVPNPESSSGKEKPQSNPRNKSGKHSSDALLAIDLNGDGVMDLLAGDWLKTSLYSFINGGKNDSSHIISVTSTFPPQDPYNAITYGLPFSLDVDNDGKNDLVVSVAVDRLEDMEGIWYYKNTGTNSSPVFSLQTKSFLQGEMINVGTQSKPVFFDYNSDSLLDLVIGNFGYFQDRGTSFYNSAYTSKLALYENIGTKEEPAFKLVDTNFANLPSYPLNISQNKRAWAYHPTFGDLDGDGDEDMILGDHEGKIHYFINQPVGGKAVFHLDQAELGNIQVGNFSTPQLFDLNDDGLLDLIIGNDVGTLHYYRNTSALYPTFVLEDNFLGEVNVTDDWDFSGYSAPYFFNDSLGNVILLSGSKSGHLRYYDSIIVADTISKKFRRLEKVYQGIWEGIYSTIHGADIDNDGNPDFVVGNQSGGLALYTSSDSIYIPGIEKEQLLKTIARTLFPNPAKNEITFKIHCGCADMFSYSVFDLTGKLWNQYESNNIIKIDLSSYAKGMYIIRAENKNRSIIITERFIKSE